MEKIWANRLIAGSKVWNEVPENRKADIKAELARRVEANGITASRYKAITGEDFPVHL